MRVDVGQGVKSVVRERGFGQRLISALLPFDDDVRAFPEFRVFVGDDFRAGLCEGFVRAGALAVPVGVEENPDRLSARLIGDEFQEFRGAFGEAAVNHQRSIRAGEEEDVRARASDFDEIVGELCGFKRGGGRTSGESRERKTGRSQGEPIQEVATAGRGSTIVILSLSDAG